MSEKEPIVKLSEPLTWNDLADEYDKTHTGRPARTLEMNKVFEWAERQSTKFLVTEDGLIHRILQ